MGQAFKIILRDFDDMMIIFNKVKDINWISKSITYRFHHYIFKSYGHTKCYRFSKSESFFNHGYYRALSSSNKVLISK
jgi:hypothetical protein